MGSTNEELFDRFMEAANGGDLDRFDKVIGPDAVDHDPFPGQAAGPEGVKQVFGMLRQAFPDLTIETVARIPEDDIVAAAQISRGTHQGEFMGAPPTGRSFEIVSVNWLRVSDGCLVDHWGLIDQMGLMMQIGMMPMLPGTEGWKAPLRSPDIGGAIGSPDENKAFVQRSVRFLNAGNMAEFLPTVHEDAVDHTGMPGQPPGRPGWEQRFGMFAGAFSDAAFEVVQQVSHGDLVSGRYRFSGRHTGDLMGMPATDRSFDVSAIDMIRIRDGKIVEHWGLIDMPSMMAQLDLMPAG
jgi:steroid delta-isomerase-like uncharacterized protein